MYILFTSVLHDIEVVDASGIAASLEAKSTKQDTDKVKLYLWFYTIMFVVWVVGSDCLEKIMQEKLYIITQKYAFSASSQTPVNFYRSTSGVSIVKMKVM